MDFGIWQPGELNDYFASFNVLNALRVLQDIWVERLLNNLADLPIGQRLGFLSLVLKHIDMVQPLHDVTCEDIYRGVSKYNDGKQACDQIPLGIHGLYFCSDDEAKELKRKSDEIQRNLAAEEVRLGEVRTRLEIETAGEMEKVMDKGVKVLILKNRVPAWVKTNDRRDSIVDKVLVRNPLLRGEMEHLARRNWDIYFEDQTPDETFNAYCARRSKKYGEPPSYVRMKVYDNAFNTMRNSLPEIHARNGEDESDYFSDIEDLEVDQAVPKVGIYPPLIKSFEYDRQAMVPTVDSQRNLSLNIRKVAVVIRGAAVVIGGAAVVIGGAAGGNGGAAAAAVAVNGGAAAVNGGAADDQDIMVINDDD